MLIATKGIVIHNVKYSDNSLISNIYTEELGTCSFMIKNAFSKKSKINYSRLAPLSIVELHFNHHKSDISFLKEINFHYHFTLIPFDPVRYSILIFYNELLYKLLFQYGEDRNLFHFLEKSIVELDSEEYSTADIHIKFMVRLSRIMGFFPENNYSKKNCHFHLHDSAFQSLFFDNGDFLSKDASYYLNNIMQNIHTIHNMIAVPNKSIRNELLHFLVKYFELHHEGGKKIESIEILSQILN